MILRALALSLLAGASANAQSFDLGAIRPSHSKVEPDTERGCRSMDPNEIVVCGTSRKPYRLDPAVLAQMRAMQAPPRAPDKAGALMSADDCAAGVGPKGCTGTPAIDFVAIAILAASAAKRAAEGEDWRDVFRIRPDSYDQYVEMKERKALTLP